MPWFKVDDGFHAHQKAVHAGTSALGLWVRCGSWAAQQVTGGKVPTHIAKFYGTAGSIRALVQAGLWEEVDGGYQFHDWDDMNPSREQVLSDRAAAKERQRAAREAAKKRREAAQTSTVVTDASQRDTLVTSADVQSPRPDPTRPVLPNGSTKEPRASVTPLPPATDRGRKLVDEHLVAFARPVPRDVQRDLHRKVEEAIADNFSDADIRGGLAILRRSNGRLGPGMLLRLIDQAIGERPQPRTNAQRMFG